MSSAVRWQTLPDPSLSLHTSSYTLTLAGPLAGRRFASWLITLFLLPGTVPLFAHDPGLSTATIQIKPRTLDVEMSFAIADAEQLINLHTNGDTRISADEFTAAAAKLQQMAFEAIEVNFDDVPAKISTTRCSFDDSRNANISLSVPAKPFTKFVIRSKWLALLPPGHRQFVSIQRAGGVVIDERLLSASLDTITIQQDALSAEPAAGATRSSFADFLLMGVKHIWTGYDHLLFLFGLLLVTRSFGSSVKIITCFTIAHSITLAVATLSLVHISSRIVEPLIAASIVYVGVENLLRGDDPKGRWLLTFAFGLIHGFGFASVLRELGVGANGSGIAVPLVSFNLGVEIGQIVVAGLILPVIWRLRSRPIFVQRWVPAGSVAIALLGAYWFCQRVWF